MDPQHSTQPDLAVTSTPNDAAKRTCPECGTSYDADLLFCPRDGASLQATRETGDLTGRMIAGRFRITRRLGGGGMGDVYLADQVAIGRQVAFKVLNRSASADADGVRRFQREARNASLISHQHVATVYDYGETEDGLIYLAMEFVNGETLAQALKREHTFPPEKTANVVHQIAEALTAAHDQIPPLVHCDLKPDNVMLTARPNGSVMVKVVDFGIAKAPGAENQHVTRTGLVAGTPAYMSPEQLMAETPNPRSDIYALGLMAFEMLTGTRPFANDGSPAGAFQRISQPPRTLETVKPEIAWSHDLQHVLDKVLAIKAEDRYDSAGAFSQAFAAAITQKGAARGGRKRSPAMLSGVLGAVIVLAGVASYALLAPRQTKSAALPKTKATPLVTDSSHTPPPSQTAAAAPTVDSTTVSPPSPRTTPAPVQKPAQAPVAAKAPDTTATIESTTPAITSTTAGGLKPGPTPVHTATSTEDTTTTATAGQSKTPPTTFDTSVFRRPGRVQAELLAIAGLTNAATATPQTARRALFRAHRLMPYLRTAQDSVEDAYHQAEAHLILNQPRMACAILTRIAGPGATTHLSAAITNLQQSCHSPS